MDGLEAGQYADAAASRRTNMQAQMRMATSAGTSERRAPDILFVCVGVQGGKHASHTGPG